MIKSEQITEIAKSLVAAQSELKNTPASAVNPHFKSRYTPLDDILDMAREVLPKHGLSVLQSVSGESETITVTTMLMHTSGQWLESDPLTMKAERTTPQGQGSAITYARRYSLSAMLGVATDPDDDGNGAEESPKQQAKSAPVVGQAPKTINKEQIGELNDICMDGDTLNKDKIKLLSGIAEKYGYKIVTQIKPEHFEAIKKEMIDSIKIQADGDCELPFEL